MKKFIKKNRALYSFCLLLLNGIAGFKQECQRYYMTETAYECTSFSKKIEKFKDCHKGERCFIIGNGPSLRAEDLDKLNGEITFAANSIYKIFDQTAWRPTYYASQDDKFIRSNIHNIIGCNFRYIFLPYNLENVKVKAKSNIFRFFVDKIDRYPELPLFSEDASKKIYECYTVSYSLLQLAVYMGFKRIFLLGMDHSYSIEVKADGTIVRNNVEDHFGGTDKVEENNNQYLPSTDKSTNAFIAAKKYADGHDINIYNATRGGKLEVFQRVDFNDIIRE